LERQGGRTTQDLLERQGEKVRIYWRDKKNESGYYWEGIHLILKE
jgi:hypothetical protein